MSDSNVGASIIFLINVVIQKMLKGKRNIQITIQINGYETCFWYNVFNSKILRYLYNSERKDNNIALLFKPNESKTVRYKAPNKQTTKEIFDNFLLPGDQWGPTIASNQVDKYRKQPLEEERDFVKKCNGHILIYVLGMFNNLIKVSHNLI